MAIAPGNEAQRAFWSEGPGTGFLAEEEALEAIHAPLGELVLAAAGIAPGHRVIDLGCGTGALARRAARLAGAGGAVCGVDVSAPMLARAGAIGSDPAPTYLLADAQSGPLPVPPADRLVSRLGVMFFSEPLAALANLRAAMAPGGTLTAVCWRRGLPDNPLFAVPVEAVAPHLGRPEEADPHAPGPMAFADGPRVEAILAAAGWRDARVWPVPVTLTPEGPADAMGRLATRIGAAARLIRERARSEATRAEAQAAIAAAFAPYETAGHVRLPTVTNLITARA